MTSASSVLAISITTDDEVVLDARVHIPSAEPLGALVMSHPHPLYGGTQDHPLVVAVCEAMASEGWLAIRFDFRGTNQSGGTHGGGIDEQLDVAAAIREVGSRVPSGTPIIAAGYSFGAATTFSTVAPQLSARVGIALPTAMLKRAPDPMPTFLVHPRHDQFTSVADLEHAASSWPDSSTRIEIIEGSDHFMNGFVHSTATSVTSWCTEFRRS